ncbi:GGDEF domain-containing protein [Vibrio gallaecicus]|uniref:GGDEF domain-containing protein n=1 Tax=Vibrio gallaecicus TaxID=552386 RepID=UPI0010C97637|nr:GGDEF domain-containing protein [Vibrio gallaecicus]MDN3613805.1 diguanylate cyclase [Vibrio gallaecicus]
MNSFTWDKNFETGIDSVDEQHQYLVGFINHYGNLLSENTLSIDDISVALLDLTRYAEFHFKEEESLMRERGVYNLHIEEHVKVHRMFMQDIYSMQAFILEEDQLSARQLLDFLIHWLAYHILGIDQNMARQVAAIEEGATPLQAFEVEEKQNDSSTVPLLAALKGLFEQVSERNKQLLRFNQLLESKVEERTAELKRANKQLEELSLTDSLTKLPNRRSAFKQLAVHWQDSKEFGTPLVCIMIDADHFKCINDTCGHDAGDLVLQTLARELKNSFRNDDIVCRLGGDEFLIICPHTDLKGGMYVAEITRQKVSELQVETGNQIWIGSISVGVAELTQAFGSINELIKAADESVYLAKNSGKNSVRSIQI